MAKKTARTTQQTDLTARLDRAIRKLYKVAETPAHAEAALDVLIEFTRRCADAGRVVDDDTLQARLHAALHSGAGPTQGKSGLRR